MTPNNRLLIAAFALAGSAVLLPFPAAATLSQSATFDDKVENAAAIVVGKVVKKESRWDSSRRFIVTYTTFRVEKALKGNASGDLTVVTPGGSVGEIYQDTIGVPEFQEGDENLVFVKNSSAGPTVLYFDQGAYEVTKDSSGERIVAPVASDAVQIDTQRGVAVAAESVRTLREFESQVKTSQRRTFNRMEMIRKQQQRPASIMTTVLRYKFLLAAAALGLALATIQLLRR
jgi:hypothetical protein